MYSKSIWSKVQSLFPIPMLLSGTWVKTYSSKLLSLEYHKWSEIIFGPLILSMTNGKESNLLNVDYIREVSKVHHNSRWTNLQVARTIL